MFILKSILQPIQSIFQKSSERSKLLTAVILEILLPVRSSRSSQILRVLQLIFGFKINRRHFYTFMTSPKLPWDEQWQCVWKLIPLSLTDGRLLLATDDSSNPKTVKKFMPAIIITTMRLK